MRWTWEELKEMKTGTVLEMGEIDGVQYVIMRASASLVAYLGVPLDHPLAGKSYDNIGLACHGGLTFGGKGDGKYRPAGVYWYGWDYAHFKDAIFYDNWISGEDIKHYFEDVKADVEKLIPEFLELMAGAEKSNKGE